MSYVEAEFIKQREYDAAEDNRLREYELVIDELYVAMFSLRSNRYAYQAAKLPAKIHDIERQESGIFLAKLGLLDSDLIETASVNAALINGYWSDVRKQIVISGIQPIHSYLREYGDSLDDELQAISTSVELQDKELVLA